MPSPKQMFALGCVIAAFAAGCSGDDDDAAGTSTTTAATATATATAVSTPVTTLASTPSSSAPAAPVTTTPGSTEATPPVCTELQRVRTLSDEISETMAPVLTPLLSAEAELDTAAMATAADTLDARLPEVLDAYDDAIAAAEDDTMIADIEAIAKATESITPVLAELFRSADSVDDLRAVEEVLSSEENQAAAIAAGEASLHLDEFTVPQCGFKFSN